MAGLADFPRENPANLGWLLDGRPISSLPAGEGYFNASGGWTRVTYNGPAAGAPPRPTLWSGFGEGVRRASEFIPVGLGQAAQAATGLASEVLAVPGVRQLAGVATGGLSEGVLTGATVLTGMARQGEPSQVERASDLLRMISGPSDGTAGAVGTISSLLRQFGR